MFKQYKYFLEKLDLKLQKYFERDLDKIECKKGCSLCCTNGDYPLSYLEMRYLMYGFSKLEKNIHDDVKKNIQRLIQNKTQKSHVCPFLIENTCSVYGFRPLICRVHGLAYLRKNGVVNLPGCSDFQLNYSKNYDGKTVDFKPIDEDLSINEIIKRENKISFGEIRSMIEWF